MMTMNLKISQPHPGARRLQQKVFEEFYARHHLPNPDEKLLLHLATGASIDLINEWC